MPYSFANPVDGSVEITFPDGRTRTIPINTADIVKNPAKGIVTISYIGEGGWTQDLGINDIEPAAADLTALNNTLRAFFFADPGGSVTLPTYANSTTVNAAWNGTFNDLANDPTQPVDGVAQVPDVTRTVLVFDDPDPSLNGLYSQVNDDDWVRTPAYDSGAELNDLMVSVIAGTVHVGTSWHQTQATPNVGVDPIEFIINTDEAYVAGGTIQADIIRATTTLETPLVSTWRAGGTLTITPKSPATAGGAGGPIFITGVDGAANFGAGAGGFGSSITLRGGNGGTTATGNAGRGGSCVWAGGDGANTTGIGGNGGRGGSLDLIGGNGGNDGDGTAGTGGNGGNITLKPGAGGFGNAQGVDGTGTLLDAQGNTVAIWDGTGWHVKNPITVVSTVGANAITIPSGNASFMITAAGVSDMTLADPDAGFHDGTRLTFMATTANAHTLSNAAGSGFNAAGAGSDLATFGGARGDNLIIEAYQGIWYIVSSKNIVLS